MAIIDHAKVSSALATIHTAEMAVKAYVEASGLPVSSVSIFNGGTRLAMVTVYCTHRVFIGHNKKRNLETRTAALGPNFFKVIDEAAIAWKERKQK